MSESPLPIVGCTTRPYNTLSAAEAFHRIARAGYGEVALFRMGGRSLVDARTPRAEITALRRAAQEAGLKISMLLGSTELDLGVECALEGYRRLIEAAAELGATWLLDCGTSDSDHYDDYCDLMRRAAPVAKEAEVRITLKPHGGISTSAVALLGVYRAVSHPSFTICYDPGNIIYYTCGACRPETDIAAVASEVSTLIVKDCLLSGPEGALEPDVAVTPGYGLVDFPGVMASLAEKEFGGPCYVECVASTEPDDVDREISYALGYTQGILRSVYSKR